MFEALKAIDTPLEWTESAVAIIVLFLGLAIGNWVGFKVYSFIMACFYCIFIIAPLFLIANGTWTTWQDIIIGSLTVGFIPALLLSPLDAFFKYESRIKNLEQGLKIVQKKEDKDKGKS